MSQIILNAEQEQARLLARQTAKNRGIGIVAGPAGTGKSTLLRAVCQDLGQVVLIAPTNRAAQRAASLTGQTASTIHGWMYTPVDSDKGLVFRRKTEVNIPPSNLIVIDEASMVSTDLWVDIWTVAEKAGAGVLLVGDAFQLPPVMVDGAEFSVFESDFQRMCASMEIPFGRVDLVQVWRQAAESPIIRACTELRKYPTDWRNAVAVMENVPTRDNDDPKGYRFPHPANVPQRISAMLEDGIDHCAICYTNEKRHQINREVRALRGLDDSVSPQPGEPLLIRRNNKKAFLSNGEIITFTGFVEDPGQHRVKLPPQYRFIDVNGTTCLTNIDTIATGRAPRRDETVGLRYPFVEANYGYAITAHASQGHEFDWAIVNWESTLMVIYRHATMRIRWLYTSFSRAKTKLLIGGLT